MLNVIVRNLTRTWREHWAMQLATLVVLTGTFTVVALFFLLQANFTQVLTQWGEKVQLAVFLSDSASEAQVAEIKTKLEDTGHFSEVRYVSKQSAAETFRRQMGTNAPELLADPEFGNPLPASFEARLRQSMNSNQTYKTLVDLAKSLESIPGVEDVSYGQGWIENYASLLRAFSSSSWLLILVMIAGSLLVVGNAIRSAIFQRREEIEVLELIGATPSYIRLPFLVEGAVLGFLASLMALGICFGLHLWQHAVATQKLGFWGLAAEAKFLSVSQSIGLVGLGTWFGVLGSYICVRHIATGWAAARHD